LATNDHFSSNCTSRVVGGKGHEFVVELLGLLARQQAQAGHGARVHADQAAGLAHAAALGDVVQDGHDLVGGQVAVEQGRALALGEAGLASLAAEEAALLGPVAHGHGQVAFAALAVVGAMPVLAAEGTQVIGFASFLAHGSLAVAGTVVPTCHGS
jgi:hypothetical protein